MFYFSENIVVDLTEKFIEAMNIGTNDSTSTDNLRAVQRYLAEKNIEFASIKIREDGYLEIILNENYILIGSCGGRRNQRKI